MSRVTTSVVDHFAFSLADVSVFFLFRLLRLFGLPPNQVKSGELELIITVNFPKMASIFTRIQLTATLVCHL